MKRIVMLAGLFAMLCQTACKPKKEEKEEVGKFTATSPLKVDTIFSKQYVSQIRSVRNIEIRAQEKGFLQNIYVDEGQFVKAGQLLFKIMPKIYEAEMTKAQAAVVKAQAEVSAAEIELQNTKVLVQKNVISKNEQSLAQAKLDQAKAEVSQAKAELNLANIHLSFTDIKAPFDGVIDRLPLKLGSLVDEGALLTTLSDNSQMFAYFNVSEPDYLDFQTHMKTQGSKKVDLLMANNQLFKYKGEVEVIESEFDSETGNIAFRARFANNDKLLKHGETGKVLMTVPLKNALVIPQKATYEIQDKIYVFVIDKDGKVKSRNITISGEVPDLYVIKSGLAEGEKILLEGVQKVKDDDKVQYDFEEPKKVVANLRLKAE